MRGPSPLVAPIGPFRPRRWQSEGCVIAAGESPEERHNSITMFSAAWSWILPLLGATAVFGAVLGITPPGFRALTDVAFGTPRGTAADAAAYAIGAAASQGLAALLVLAAVCFALDVVLQRGRALTK